MQSRVSNLSHGGLNRHSFTSKLLRLRLESPAESVVQPDDRFIGVVQRIFEVKVDISMLLCVTVVANSKLNRICDFCRGK